MPAISMNTGAVQFTGTGANVVWVAGWNHATNANAANRTFKKKLAQAQALPADFAVGAIDLIENEGGWSITDTIAALNGRRARTTHLSVHSGDPDGSGGPNDNAISSRQSVTFSAAVSQ